MGMLLDHRHSPWPGCHIAGHWLRAGMHLHPGRAAMASHPFEPRPNVFWHCHHSVLLCTQQEGRGPISHKQPKETTQPRCVRTSSSAPNPFFSPQPPELPETLLLRPMGRGAGCHRKHGALIPQPHQRWRDREPHRRDPRVAPATLPMAPTCWAPRDPLPWAATVSFLHGEEKGRNTLPSPSLVQGGQPTPPTPSVLGGSIGSSSVPAVSLFYKLKYPPRHPPPCSSSPFS